MFEINHSLIEREDDRCYFDPTNFRVLKFNDSGYRFIAGLKGFTFSQTVFSNRCKSIPITSDQAAVLWDKCIDHRVIVQAD